MKSGTCIHTLRGHTDEILDVTFNTTGSRLVTASADGQSRVYNTMTGTVYMYMCLPPVYIYTCIYIYIYIYTPVYHQPSYFHT